MKKSLLLLGALWYAATGFAQFQLVSDTSWGLSSSQNGPFNLPVYEVTNCVDEAYIDAQCGSGYGSPMLAEHFAGCTGMKPIWVAPPPSSCYYPPTPEHWFRKTFSLCTQPEMAQVRIQADQKFTLFINGTQVGSSTDSDWNVVRSYDVAGLLTAGNNTILVKVDNIDGGSCFNYAFLAFCLQASATTLTLNPMRDSSICSGQSLTLRASPGGAAYAWSPAAGLSATNVANPVASPSATTTYSVTITDPCGGAAITDDVVVEVRPLPAATAGNDGPYCPGDPVQLNAGGGLTYAWSGPGGFVSTLQNPLLPAFSAAQAGGYTVAVTGPNGCSATAVTQVQALPAPEVNITSPLVLCFDAPPIQLTATPEGGEWSGAAPLSGMLDPAAVGTGLHTITYTYIPDPAGCTVAATATLEVVDELRVDIQDTGPFCLTSPVQQLAATPAGGVWSGAVDAAGSFDPEALGLGLHDATYTYAPSPGCMATDNIAVAVINSPINAALGADVAIRLGETATLSATVGVPLSSLVYAIWEPGGIRLDCPDCLTLDVGPFETTTYSVLLADANGCESEDQITVEVDNSKPVYVPTAFSPNDDGVNDVLSLFADPVTVRQVRYFKVFGRWGELIYEAKDFSPSLNPYNIGWDGTHRGQLVNPGTYAWMAEVQFADDSISKLSGSITIIR